MATKGFEEKEQRRKSIRESLGTLNNKESEGNRKLCLFDVVLDVEPQ